MTTILHVTDFLTTDRQELERLLLKHFVEECDECKAHKPKQWMFLCTDHAPIVRAVLNPQYAVEMRGWIATCEQRIAELTEAIPQMERVEKGRTWVADQVDQKNIDAGDAKVVRLLEEIPQAYRAYTVEQLTAWKGLEEGKLANLRQRYDHAVNGANELLGRQSD